MPTPTNPQPSRSGGSYESSMKVTTLLSDLNSRSDFYTITFPSFAIYWRQGRAHGRFLQLRLTHQP